MIKLSRLCLILWMCIIAPSHAQNLLPTTDRLQIISHGNIEALQQFAAIDTSASFTLDMEWSPDGRYLAVITVTDNPRVEIWDFLNDDIPLNPIATFTPELVRSIHWLPDSTQIVTHGQQYADGNLQSYVAMWSAEDGEIVETLLDTETEPQNCCDPIAPPIVGWNSDYSIAATLQDSHTFQITTGQLFAFRDPISLFASEFTEEPVYGTIVDAVWSPYDRYIAIEHATQDQYRFHIVDAQTLESVLYFYGEDHRTCNLIWSPDDATLAVISERISAGTPSSATQIHLYPVNEPVCYGECAILLWLDSSLLHNRCNPAFTWSPDSRMVVIGTATTLDFYETSELNLVHSFADENIFVLDWHPTQRIIASGGIDGIIRLWGVPESD